VVARPPGAVEHAPEQVVGGAPHRPAQEAHAGVGRQAAGAGEHLQVGAVALERITCASEVPPGQVTWASSR
jgi:hypothetical protein